MTDIEDEVHYMEAQYSRDEWPMLFERRQFVNNILPSGFWLAHEVTPDGNEYIYVMRNKERGGYNA